MFAALFVGCAASDESDLSLAPSTPVARQQVASRTLDIPVKVKTTGSAVLKCNVVANPAASEFADSTVLSIAGLSASGRVFDAFNAALVADSLGSFVRQTITLDLPGHGQSPMPTGVKYGDVNIDDNIDIVVQTLEALNRQGSAPALITAHGLGALYVAGAQQKLLDRGSSLSKLGVRGVLMYTPVPSHGLPWTQPKQDPNSDSYVKNDPVHGAVYTQPAAQWVFQNFSTRAGKLAAGAPTPADVTARGWAAPEPLATVLQLAEIGLNDGDPIVPRPTLRANLFAAVNRTQLIVVTFPESSAMAPAEVTGFYRHLTGDRLNAYAVSVPGPDSVNYAFITVPQRVIEATRMFFF
ncbi:MAG: alpha/beta fold hydrolase [Polyangiales bacterium]